MPPTGKFPLGPGSLGISFADVNGIPTVSDVDKDSSVGDGMIAVGFRFLSLILDNGVILEDMNTYELVEALQRSSDHMSRYLKLQLCLPASTVVTLPPGKHGLIIQDSDETDGGLPMVVGVVPGYSKDIRVGMVVDGISTADGLRLSGYNAKVYNDVLANSEHQSQRTIQLISPETTPSPKSRVLPSFRQVPLPPGDARSLGLGVLGDNCTIASGESMGTLPRGFRIQTLTTEEGHQFRNVSSEQMASLLDLTSQQTGRAVVLKNPEKLTNTNNNNNVVMSQWKLAIPDDGDAKELGLTLEGTPVAKLTKVSRQSPVYPYIHDAQVDLLITKVSWDGTAGPEFEGLDANDVEEILADSSGFPNRLLWCTTTQEEDVYQSIPQRGDAPSVVHSVEHSSVASPTARSARSSSVASLSQRSKASSVGAGGAAAVVVVAAGGPPSVTSPVRSVASHSRTSVTPSIPEEIIPEEIIPEEPEEEEEPELPDELMVELPMGKVGAIFQGDPPLLLKLAPESPLRDMGVPLGMTVDYLSLPNGQMYTNMETIEFVNALKSTTNQEGRMLHLINANVMPMTIVEEQEEEEEDESEKRNKGEVIPVTRRSPSRSPTGSQTTEDHQNLISSMIPVHGSTKVTNSFESDQQDVQEALQELEELPEEFQNIDEIQDAIHELEELDEQYDNQNNNDNDAIMMELPSGPIGLIFSKDKPAIVKKVREGSPLEGIVEPGMLVDTFESPDGTMHYNLDGVTLASYLKEYKTEEGRKMRFITADMELTRIPKGGAASVGSNASSGIQVPLPTGKLGMSFRSKKEAPAIISKIKPSGPLDGYGIRGKAIDTLTLEEGGQPYFEMNAEEVTNLLKRTSDQPGRVMKVRDPSSQNFQTIPDDMTVVLPVGSLLCSIAGTPPRVKSFKDGSPIAGLIPPKMFIDGIQMEDGYTRLGMTAPELVQLLSSHRQVEGRTLLLKNGKTQEPSEPEEIFPEELILSLPSGKLGISFKGKSARVSRIHDQSILADQLYVGMLVDMIEIPGGSIFTGVKASEASRILKDTSRVEGRILSLRAPSAKDLLQPRDDDALEASNYSTSQRN